MKLILKSSMNILDDRFITHLINSFPNMIFTTENIRKLSKINNYLQENIFTGRRKFTTKQVVNIVLKNIVYQTDGKTATIQIDNSAIFPFYTFKVKDIAKLIDDGNLDIKGTHIFHNMFKYVEKHIIDLRNNYEMGML